MPVRRVLGVPKTTDSRVTTAEVISVLALFVALFGSVAAVLVAVFGFNHLSASSRTARRLSAETELQLCQNIYGQFYNSEKEARNQVTVQYLKKELPGISIAAINNISRIDRAAAKKVEHKFEPSRCANLPFVKTTLGKEATTSTVITNPGTKGSA